TFQTITPPGTINLDKSLAMLLKISKFHSRESLYVLILSYGGDVTTRSIDSSSMLDICSRHSPWRSRPFPIFIYLLFSQKLFTNLLCFLVIYSISPNADG